MTQEITNETVGQLAQEGQRCGSHIHTAWGGTVLCDNPQHDDKTPHAGWLLINWADNPHSHES